LPASVNTRCPKLAISAAVISAVVIIARFHLGLPRGLSAALAVSPDQTNGIPRRPGNMRSCSRFTGVRGIVSLAAALAIPFTHDNRSAVPRPDLILFLTFSVILVTLVGQGLMLPSVIRALGLAHAGRREHEAPTKRKSARPGDRRRSPRLNRLDELTAAGNFSEEILRPIRVRQHHRLEHIEHGDDLDDRDRNFRDLHDEIEFLLIAPSVSTSMSNIGLAS